MHKKTIIGNTNNIQTAQTNNNKPPLINLSSDQQQNSDSQNQSHIEKLKQINNNRKSNSSQIQSIYSNRTQLIKTTPSNTYKQPCNFSTLSFQQNSLQDYDNLLKSLKMQNEQLSQKCIHLQSINKDIHNKINQLEQKLQHISIQNKDYIQKIVSGNAIIDTLKQKNKVLEEQLKKVTKKCDNLITNKELSSRINQYQKQMKKIQDSIHEQIQLMCTNFINDLSKQKMNIKVQNIIQEFVKNMISITKKQQKNKFQEYKFINFNKDMQAKTNFSMAIRQSNKQYVSNDYKLLQKSIQKLKNMQKQMKDKNNNSYFKKQNEGKTHNKEQRDSITHQNEQHDSNSHYKRYNDSNSYYKKQNINCSNLSKSIILDTSITGLNRSKSKRKRIFQ